MMVTLALAVFCGGIALASLQLSPTAGRLPASIALLTLLPILWQHWLDPTTDTPEKRRLPIEFPLFIAALFLTGFLIAVPSYAAWTFRRRAITAALAAAGAAAAFLLLLDQQVELYRGALWPR